MSEPVARLPVLAHFLGELVRRRVIRVAAVYAVIGWITIEVSATVLPPLHLPDWTVTLVIVLVALGFPLAVVMAWLFELGPSGVELTPPSSAIDEPAARAVAPAAAPAVVPTEPARSGIHCRSGGIRQRWVTVAPSRCCLSST